MSKDKPRKTKKNSGKVKIIIILILMVLLLVVAMPSLYINSKLDKLQVVDAKEEVEAYTEQELSCVDVDGFINILFLGIDTRDMSNLEGWRADAIIIASIKEDTGEIFLTSVYRDTFLLIGDAGFYDKVTHSFYYDGMKGSIKTLNQAMDLDIKNYVVFNFKAVADIVNAVGGLEINVEEYEIYELNRITSDTCRILGQQEVRLVSEPGLQLLDGAQAVTYGRIRKGVGDDFKRTERMRTVIVKLVDKIKTMKLGEINNIIDIGIEQVKTNLGKSDIISLAMRMSSFKIAGSEGFPYNVATGTLNGTSYVFPTNLYGDVAKLHEDFFGQKDYSPSDMVAIISDEAYQSCLKTEDQGQVDIEEYYDNPENQFEDADAASEGEQENSPEVNPQGEDNPSADDGESADIEQSQENDEPQGEEQSEGESQDGQSSSDKEDATEDHASSGADSTSGDQDSSGEDVPPIDEVTSGEEVSLTDDIPAVEETPPAEEVSPIDQGQPEGVSDVSGETEAISNEDQGETP